MQSHRQFQTVTSGAGVSLVAETSNFQYYSLETPILDKCDTCPGGVLRLKLVVLFHLMGGFNLIGDFLTRRILGKFNAKEPFVTTEQKTSYYTSQKKRVKGPPSHTRLIISAKINQGQ